MSPGGWTRRVAEAEECSIRAKRASLLIMALRRVVVLIDVYDYGRSTGECTGIVEGCQEKIYGLALRGELLLSGEAEGGGGGGGKARLWLLDGKRTRAAPAAVFSEHTATFGALLSARRLACLPATMEQSRHGR